MINLITQFKTILVILLFVICEKANNRAVNYYINSKTGNDNNTGTAANSPWKSLKKLEEINFQPGDSILFAKNTEFQGGFTLESSGKQGKPIVLSCYGQGSNPSFTNPDYTILNGNTFRINGSHIIIDGLNFYDGAASPTEQSDTVRSIGAVFISCGANFNIVKNCEFCNCPVAVKIYGRHNHIANNYIHDCNRGLSPKYWGPIGIVVCASDNELSYNRIENYIAPSPAWGADGGAIELDDSVASKDNIYIHHNYSSNNEGFLETYEYNGTTKSLDNLVIAYNVSVKDYQAFTRLSWNGMRNARIENNTIIFTCPKNNVVVPSVFDLSHLNKRKKVTGNEIAGYYNNIIVLGNNNQVSPYFMYKHSHNLFFDVDGRNNPEQLIGKGEKLESHEIITDPQFINSHHNDYRLSITSPAIDHALNLGYTTDFLGMKVPQGKGPDIGAYETKK